MTTAEIEESYRQAVIKQIAEDDIKEIKLLVKSGNDIRMSICATKMRIKQAEKIYNPLQLTKAVATIENIKQLKEELGQLEENSDYCRITIKDIINTRQERIQCYLGEIEN